MYPSNQTPFNLILISKFMGGIKCRLKIYFLNILAVNRGADPINFK